MRSLWLAVGLVAACGDVQKVPDAAIPDAYAHDSAVAPTCGAGEMVCNNTCANLMTSELYCGNCTTQCTPTQGCLNGACVPANTSCTRVRELDPAAPDGAYRNPNTGVVFACDYTAHKQYEFGIGQYNVGYSGFTIMTVGSFDAGTKAAFLQVYNALGGFQTIAPFTSNTCCITQPNNNELTLNNQYLSLAQNNANTCNINYNGVYQIMRQQTAGMALVAPLPADFWTTNTIGEAAVCGDSINIGLFVKITAF